MPLYTLVYSSVANRPMTEQDISNILESCKRNNTPNEITGILLYGKSHFMQALEGEKDVVLSTYRKITADRRHRLARILYQQEIKERNFGEWSMAFRNVEGLDPKVFEGVQDLLTLSFNDDRLEGKVDRVKVFLNIFRERNLI